MRPRRKGVEYVSTIEHQRMPFFGTQWHPEKPPFEFSDTTIPHTHDAIAVSQHLRCAQAAARPVQPFATYALLACTKHLTGTSNSFSPVLFGQGSHWSSLHCLCSPLALSCLRNSPDSLNAAVICHVIPRSSGARSGVFLDYARRSTHRPVSVEEELAMLIYNYHAVFTARDIVMEPSYDGAAVLCSPAHICMSRLLGKAAAGRMHCP